MIEIGRVCVKIAGRDAGKRCVIVDILEDGFVLIDGETRRRRCNVIHLEPTKETVKIEKDASHEEVTKTLGIEARATKRKSAGARPAKQRKTTEAKPAKKVDKAAKKAVPKTGGVVKKVEEPKKTETKAPEKKPAVKKAKE